MIPVQLAQLCADIYDKPTSFDLIYDAGGVYCGLLRQSGQDIFVFRGSVTIEEWIDDIECIPHLDPYLGFVHRGMFSGILDFYSWAISVVRPDCKSSFVGHSLGGAHARFAAGLFAYNCFATDFLMTFGSPKCAHDQLKWIIEASGIEHTSFRHGYDVVPTLPPDIPCEFRHTEDYFTVMTNIQPRGNGISDHLINSYIAALK